MMILMCDDIEIASLDSTNSTLKLREDIPYSLIPKDLYNDKDIITYEELIEWAEERVFPPNRVGVERLLEELGLNTYDGWLIAQKTRASLMTDFYWIKFFETDTYEKNSVRGRSNIPSVSTISKFKNVSKFLDY